MDQENKGNVFLATTAIEDFWDTTKPVVFLGDWCLRYSRRDVWGPLNGEIHQGTWKDKKRFIDERFIDAYMYSKDVYERLLQRVSALLDEVHEEQHDIRYWRIIIGPWLFHYIDVLYDHYLSIQTARSKYPSFDTIVLSEGSFVTPRSTVEFVLLLTEDPYNLQVYSRILSLEKNDFRKRSFNIERKAQSIPKKDLLGLIKKKLIMACARGIALAMPGGSICLADPYFPKSSTIKIFLKSKGKVRPIFSTNEEMPVATPNEDMRESFKKISLNDTEFENLVLQLLPYDIPQSFLESYKMIKKEALTYPSKPGAIISWVSWYFDERFKIWAATAAEAGSSLYGVQHGGNYGIDRYLRTLDHEVAITDKFYSWGWNDTDLEERIVPMNVSMAIGKKEFEKNNKNTRILFAGTSVSRYFYRLQYPTNNHLEKYLGDQISFLKGLDINCRRNVIYRAFMQDYGLDISERIQDLWPNMIIEGWDIPFQKSLLNCRLFVCDQLGTVHAESLSLNVPTILFWDPDSMICRREARERLDDLRAVGILHDSPGSAASKVCEVYDDVYGWWNEREIQSARSEFCEYYAKNSPNAMDEWMCELKKIGKNL